LHLDYPIEVVISKALAIAARIRRANVARISLVLDGFDVGDAVERIAEIEQPLRLRAWPPRTESYKAILPEAGVVTVRAANVVSIIQLLLLAGRTINDIGN
jgi:hypothetical protein